MDEEEDCVHRPPSRPGGSGGGRGPHRRPSSMTAATLRDLKRDDPATILTRLSRPNSGLIEFIKRSDLGADDIKLLVEVLGKACLCESMQECLNSLLVEIQMTYFIDTTLSQLLLQVCMRRNGDDEILKSVLPFFKTLLAKMPIEGTTNVELLVVCLENLWLKGGMKNEDINHGMEELRELLVRSQPPPPQAAQQEAEEISSNEPTDPSDDSDTSDQGGGAAPSVLIQHGVRNEATISSPITGITQVGRENIINVHTETETFKIKVRPKHKDVEAVVAINMVVPDEDLNPNRALVLGQETSQGEVNAGEEIVISIESDALTKRQERSRNRNTIGCGLRSTTVTFITALFRRVNMIVNNLRNGSIVIGLQPKTDSAVFDLINAVDEGIIKELVCGIFENEPGLITEEASGEQIKLKIDINIPNGKFPKAFPCKQFVSRKELLKELTVSVQREEHGQKDKGPIVSNFPTCQVCHQQFSHRGPAPFLLPCGHSACETCVTFADGGMIECRLCQRDVNLTETLLQKDVVREREILTITVQHHPELVLCTNEEDGNQAVCWCKECDDFLCEHCQMVHNGVKITQNHNVHKVEAMELVNVNEDKYCTVHPKILADTWDSDCRMFTCGKCRRGDHAGHEVVDVEEAAEIARDEVSKYGNGIKSTVEQHKTHLAATERDLQCLDEKINTIDEKITLTISSLNTQIDQRSKELQIALQNHIVNMKDQLNDKKKTSETSYQRCLATSDFIDRTLMYSSPNNILELKPMLEEIFQDCRRSAPTEDYKSLPLPVFNTDGLEIIKTSLAQFGTITTDCSATTNKMQDHGTQTEDNIVQELEKLTQEIKQLESSKKQLMKEKEKEKTDFREAAEKLRQEVKQLKMTEDDLNKEKEKMKRDSGKEAEKLRQEVKQLKMSQDQHNRQNEKLKKESKEAAEKLRQETKTSNAYKEKIAALEEEIEKGWHILRDKALDKLVLLKRTDIKFSMIKYNTEMVYINTDGNLINKPQPNPPHSDQRLKKYSGTCSTAPLPQCGSPQYFEVESQVGIEKTLPENHLLLEIGLAREEEQDQHHCIDGQPHSYCLNVAHCTIHSSICREVRRHGTPLTCLSDTLENTPGTTATLHYGVVYDSARSRIAFLDVKNEKIIGKIDNVDSSVALWPMFGVYNPDWATVSMSLVVGGDINMTDKKKGLILDCLS